MAASDRTAGATPRRGSRALTHIRRSPRTLIIGSLILILYLFIALTGQFWAPYPANKVGTGPPFAPLSSEHLFGTDQLGRDVFSRVVNGTRVVLFLSLTSTLVAMIVGGALGLASGLVGGAFDETLMRLFDVVISIPLLILALLVIAAAGPELSGNYILLIGVVALVYAPRIAKVSDVDGPVVRSVMSGSASIAGMVAKSTYSTMSTSP
ncbi:hypothetical protein ACFLWA_13190, partial [Chloroflexota bacterium]